MYIDSNTGPLEQLTNKLTKNKKSTNQPIIMQTRTPISTWDAQHCTYETFQQQYVQTNTPVNNKHNNKHNKQYTKQQNIVNNQ
jgi:hypothetical protein